jgi:hypothetical protein
MVKDRREVTISLPFLTGLTQDLTDQDVLDMGAYLMTLGPVSHEVQGHETPIWVVNWMMTGWNILADLFESRKVELTGFQIGAWRLPCQKSWALW